MTRALHNSGFESMTARRRFIAKVGSQVLCSENGALEPTVLEALASQLARLRADGWEVLLVSSGAVAAGKSVAGEAVAAMRNPVTVKQVLAAAGQVRLMETWQNAFRQHGLQTAQLLLSKADFQSREHYLNTRACVEGTLEAGLVPVINENDVVAVTELMFTDNDELAGMLAGMIDAQVLALLSSVEGVHDPSSGATIGQWDDTQHSIESVVRSGTSQLGRGGMHSKLSVARRTASLGTDVTIADGRVNDVLCRLAAGEAIGTHFPASNRVPPAKRWLASMDDHALGVVVINDGARDALLDRNRLTSLLPVGIVALNGDFQQGDVIQVRDEQERLLGCGRSGYDEPDARRAAGRRDQKPLIHYDYLILFD